MRPFDRRLMRRVAAVRWVLAADVLAGLAAAVLLLAQMTVLAGVIADAVQGRLDAVGPGILVVLALVVAARAVLAWVVERTGRRAANEVMSSLRADLVRSRLRPAGFAAAAEAEPDDRAAADLRDPTSAAPGAASPGSQVVPGGERAAGGPPVGGPAVRSTIEGTPVEGTPVAGAPVGRAPVAGAPVVGGPGEGEHAAEQLVGAGAAEVAAAAVQGVDGLETYFARYLPQVVLAVTVPAAVLLWTAAIDLTSALIMLVTIPVIPVFLWLIGTASARRSRRSWLALAVLSGHFLDVVRGLPTLRAFNRGRAQLPKIAAVTEAYRVATMSTLRLAFLSGLVLDLATTLSTALVAVSLGVRLVEGGIELRPALTVLLLVPELYAPIRAVGTLFHASTDGLAAAERILELTEGAPGPDAPAARPVGSVSGAPADPPARSATRSRAGSAGSAGSAAGSSAGWGPGSLAGSTADPRSRPLADPSAVPIRLEGVSVRFARRGVQVLDGLDLELAPGEVVAIVGPSGVGKTTLGRVLLGLQAPSAGRVRVGDEVLVPDRLDAWRRWVAWAPQRPSILHGTLRHNLTLGRPGADADELARGIAAAGLDDVVAQLPVGLDTVIGTGGRGLSMGQRQRVGLARALIRRPSLLVVDEPTAHLDPTSRATVLTTLTGAAPGLGGPGWADGAAGRPTVVVLTHDPELAAAADRVVVLDGGRAVAAGPDAVPPVPPVPAEEWVR